MNTQLLCLFTIKEELDISIDFILGSYILTNPNVFILESKMKPEEFFIFLQDKLKTKRKIQWKI
jgi:hypothetical protein